MILVTAGHGNQARRLIPKLISAGERVRAVRRGPGEADAMLAIGATEAVVGDLLDPAVRRKALDGVDRVYHVGPSVHPQEAAMGLAMVEAAREAGVRHFVYSSVLHAILPSLIHHQAKLEVERAIIQTPMAFTILQPGDFMETNIAPETAFETSEFIVVWDLDHGHSMVSLDDLTDVAAKVLLEGERHHSATYPLVAPGCPNAHDVARIISTVAGRTVTARRRGFDERRASRFREEFGEAGAAYQRQLFEKLDEWFAGHDFRGNGNILAMLLGRRPLTVEEWVKRRWANYTNNA